MKFAIIDLFSKFDQIHSFLRIWLHLLEKSLMENFIFRAVCLTQFWIRPSSASLQVWGFACNYISYKTVLSVYAVVYK